MMDGERCTVSRGCVCEPGPTGEHSAKAMQCRINAVEVVIKLVRMLVDAVKGTIDSAVGAA